MMNDFLTQPWPYVVLITALVLGRRLKFWGWGFGMELNSNSGPNKPKPPTYQPELSPMTTKPATQVPQGERRKHKPKKK